MKRRKRKRENNKPENKRKYISHSGLTEHTFYTD